MSQDIEASIDNRPIHATIGEEINATIQGVVINSPGTVNSVNTQAGDVVLDQDDILDGATYKQYSQTEKTKLAGIEAGAEVNTVDSVAGKTGVVSLDKSDVGLGNVVNSDTTTTANITDSTNKRFVTDAEKTKLSNTSGTNTGDQDLSPYLNKSSDDTDDITEGATNKFATTAEKTKLGHITVTQAVDLDTIESDTATNNAKVSNATHTGDVTGATGLTAQPAIITGKPSATVAGGDLVMIADTNDSNALKQVTAQSIADLGGGGVSDGDKGDITVSSSGTVWSIDNDTVGLDELSATGTPSSSTYLRGDNTWATVAGSGAVDSVNGETGVVVLDADDIDDASTTNKFVTSSDITKLSNLSGTNTGDQTSIVGITGTKAQFDTAVSDGNILYVGDITQYTDELAQDAVGNILVDSAEIDFTYNDGTPSIAASIVAGSIDETKLDTSTNASLDLADSSLQPNDPITDLNATNWRVFYSNGTGDITELALGADGTFLKSNGASVAPTFATPAGSGDVSKVGTPVDNQIGVWTGDGTIEGDGNLTWSGSQFGVTGNGILIRDASTPTVSYRTRFGFGADFEGAGGGGLYFSVWSNADFTGTQREYIRLFADQNLVEFNYGEADVDIRFKGDTDANLMFLDASTDRVGIGTDTPSEKLDVNGNVKVTDDAYDATSWNGNTTVPTKNAVRDKIESIPTETATYTNKRVTPRIGTTTSSATPTINTDNVDFYSLTAQAVDITSFTTNLSGTPTNGQKLWISITGTAARAITWGASFEASTVALPTTTVTTERLDVGFVWNAATSKWRCVAATQAGAGGSYTDEQAQDAVGGMAANSTFVSLTYNDTTPSLTPALSATGTPSASTFLRGDNTWATPAGGGSLPTQTGNDRKILRTDGSSAEWVASNPGLTTYTIAANDASTRDKAIADYVCDGTADDVEINAALTALGTSGGRIMLSKGTFTLASTIAIIGDGTTADSGKYTIVGQGPDTTILNPATGVHAFTLTLSPKVNIGDMSVNLLGSSDGIRCIAPTSGAGDRRGFWHSEFHNLQFQGDSSTHSGWCMNLESPFRSTFRNIQGLNVKNGIWLKSHYSAFNPGNLVFQDCHMDLGVANGTGYYLQSADDGGFFNICTFIECDAIDSAAGSTTSIGWRFKGSGTSYFSTRDILVLRSNVELFNTGVKFEKGASIEFNGNYMDTKTGGTVFDFSSDSVNNHVKAFYVYVPSPKTTAFIVDANTDALKPNTVHHAFARVETGGTLTITKTSATVLDKLFRDTDGSGTYPSEWQGQTTGLVVQDEGTELFRGTRKINFTGAGVTTTNSGPDITVDIPGGGGGGGVSQAEFDALEDEVIEARGSRSSLNLRMKTISNFASPNALGFVEGAWITNSFHGTNLSTIGGAIDRLELSPFYSSDPIRIDSIGVRVTTAHAAGGGTCRVLIYEDDGNGYPGDLVYAGIDLSTTSTGAKQDGTVDITLDNGRQYWIGVHWNSGATVRAINTSSAANLGLSSSNSASFFNKLRLTSASYGSHPSTWSFTSGQRTTGNPPAVIMRTTAP